MKLVMDEKLKHRLIGLAVIISLGAIFAPAVVRKSSQRLENTYTVNVKLPPKPLAPNVAATEEKELFKTIKVARVQIPSATADKPANPMVKAKPISTEELASQLESSLPKISADEKVANVSMQDSATITATNAVMVAANEAQVAKRIAKKAPVKQPVPIATQRIVAHAKPKAVYAVQLASFSQLANAQSLVIRLQKSGYKASVVKIATRHGSVYKVYAGHSPSKTEAQRLKTHFASSMRLNGFVVNTGVS